MNEEAIEKRLKKSRERVAILEKMLEDKTRELYLEHQQLKFSKNFLEQIIRAMSHGLLVVEPTFIVLMTNSSAAQIFGIPEDELIGMSLLELLPFPEGQELSQDNTERFDKTEMEFIIQNPQLKHQTPCSVSFSVMKNFKGEPDGVVCVVRDLTKQRQLERQLLQAQKLESVGQLTAGIAHEINTPIQYVRDNTSFLTGEFSSISTQIALYRECLERVEEEQDTKEILAKIRSHEKDLDLDYILEEIPKALDQTLEGAEAVAQIVRSMKEFSHPGGEEKVLQEIGSVIHSVVNVSRNEWKYVSELDVEVEDALPPVPCFPGEIAQALLNLIVNAAHAIGDVTERGSKGLGKITVSASRRENGIRLSVQDSGGGIPSEIGERVFDPFFTTKEVGKGTGQGLSLVHATVVERHGGEIFFESEVGKGTTFIIDLPLAEEHG